MSTTDVLAQVRAALDALGGHPTIVLASAVKIAAYLREHGAESERSDLVAASPLSERSATPKIKAVAGQPTQVLIMGEIGWEVTAQGVLDALTAADGSDLDIRINSPGGSAFEGFAIFNMLARYPGRKTVTVESVAASAASFIAMAGDDVVMAPASFLMIHNSIGMTMGDRQAHEATIAVLDRIDATMAGIYAARTGQTAEAMQALMAAETWFTADEAVAQGFADRIEVGAEQPDAAARATPRAAALIRAFGRAPEAVLAMAADVPEPTVPPASPEVETVVVDPTPVVPPAAPPAPAVVPPVPTAASSAPTPPAAPNSPALPAPKETPMPATLEELQAIAARAKLDPAWILSQLTAKVTKEAATEAAWEAVSARSIIRPAATLPGAADPKTNALAMIVASIAVRGGVKRPELIEVAAAMRGLTLRDMAAEFYEARHGQRPRMGTEALFREVFASGAVGMQTTSDFGQLLGQAIQTIVIDTALSVSTEWRKIVRTYDFTDFRQRDVAGAFDVPDLEEVPEHGEVRYGTIARTLGKLGLKTFAKAFAFTRQAIINQDLTQFTTDGATFGAMAGRSLSKRVWGLFANGGAYVMPDGNPWLSTARGNAASAGSAITDAALTTAEQALALQAAVPGKPLGLGARYLVVGINRRREALKILNSEQINGSDNTYQNSYELIYEPSFPVNAWAMMADPAVHPTIAVSLLNGEEAPTVITESNFESDGLKVKVRLDYEAAPIDVTGVYYNPGV